MSCGSRLATPKIFQTGAFVLENGRATPPSGVQSSGWGCENGRKTPGAGDAIPWKTFDTGVEPSREEDSNITTNAYATSPRTIGLLVDNPLGLNARFNHFNHIYYWLMGFEDIVRSVQVAGNAVAVGGTPVAGDVYVGAGGDEFTFIRSETVKNSTNVNYVFETTTGAGDNFNAEDTLDNGSGITITMETASPQMYEHLFLLDSVNPQKYRAYTSAEQTYFSDLYLSGDIKNPMATIAKKFSNTDYRYSNAICNGASFKFSSAGLWELDTEFCAYKEERGDYSSDDWTFADSSLGKNENVPAHYQTIIKYGALDTAFASLVELGVKDFEVSIQHPLRKDQDTISGLYLAEPVFEGKYELKLNMTVNRYSSDAFDTYRDNNTPFKVYTEANWGFYKMELLLHNVTLSNAGPDSDDVAKNVIEGDINYDSANLDNFDDIMNGQTGFYKSPLMLRVRNTIEDNMMFKN